MQNVLAKTVVKEIGDEEALDYVERLDRLQSFNLKAFEVFRGSHPDYGEIYVVKGPIGALILPLVTR